jgi:hypothetical protein
VELDALRLELVKQLEEQRLVHEVMLDEVREWG